MSPMPEQTFYEAPFAKMTDSLDPPTADPLAATLLQNCYPGPGPANNAVLGRPGFKQMGSQLGSGGNRRVQGFHQYTKADGTEFTVAFCGGLMYTFNWGTRVWSNVALSGVSLDASARIRCVTFANVMVVSDGVNRPWTWDGTTFVDLTNAPVAYGPPTVYYGKLFLIKNSNRIRMVWSEENLPNTGYEAITPANSWDLYQTGTAPLERLLGTNEALYYWRAKSTGRITGAVTPDFVAAGTREGVSDTIGTRSPDGVVIYDDVIYFPSSDGQPFRLPTAGSLEPLWENLRETFRGWAKSALPSAWATHYPPVVGVVLGMVGQDASDITQYVALDHQRPDHLMGLWSGFTSTAIGLVKDTGYNYVLLHGTANGYVYDHGNPEGTYWQDENNAVDGGTLAIAHGVVGSALGYSVRYPKYWSRLDVVFRLITDLTGLQVDYETPHGARPSTPLVLSLAAGNAQWDVALWDVDSWGTDDIERKVSVGFEGAGRWLRPRLRHQYGVEQFALLGLGATAFIDEPVAETR